MELSPTTLIVIGIVCVFLGIMLSVLLNTLREESEPVASGDEAPPGGKRGRYTPVTRLWRDKKTGALVVELEAKSFTAPTALSEDERSMLEQADRDLRGWLGLGLPPAAPVQPQAAPVIQSQAVPVQTPPPAAVTSQPPAAQPPAPQVTPGPISTPAEPAPQYREARPASTAPNNEPRPRAMPTPPLAKDAQPAAKPTSIVGQIDAILQDMLLSSPLENRGIKLTEDPTRGVIVIVGIHRYEGIDNVPDPEIKALIRSAVQVWESEQ